MLQLPFQPEVGDVFYLFRGQHHGESHPDGPSLSDQILDTKTGSIVFLPDRPSGDHSSSGGLHYPDELDYARYIVALLNVTYAAHGLILRENGVCDDEGNVVVEQDTNEIPYKSWRCYDGKTAMNEAFNQRHRGISPRLRLVVQAL